MDRNSQFFYLLFLIVLFNINIYAEYLEGIDTTDNAGWGIDSSFQIKIIQDSIITIDAEKGITYAFDSVNEFVNTTGYFPYSFDEIRKAPDTIKEMEIYNIQMYKATFIFMKKDSTFTKLQLLERISANRFVYKYGRNREPKNRLLTYENYNRDSLYPPDNFHVWNYWVVDTCAITRVSWDPPIENNNTLIGYKLYFVERDSVNINDSINLDNWKPSEIIYTTSERWGGWGYYNIVAVYEEGESKPLDGWMYVYNDMTFIYNNTHSKTSVNNLKIHCYNFGTIKISLPNNYDYQKASFNIYNTKGRLINHMSNFEKNTITLNTSELGMASGNYIIQFITNYDVFTDKFYYQK